jgi:hypothetical protein
MSTYEIKTHRNGRAYSTPHFFILIRTERKEIVLWTILVKGPGGAFANSGKPMNQPCPNCFVITTQSNEFRESLYYLCLSLKIGKYFAYYLKGSVIPFICISDAKKVINTALQNNQNQQWTKKVEKLKKINAFEVNLKQQLTTISQLKIALLRS